MVETSAIHLEFSSIAANRINHGISYVNHPAKALFYASGDMISILNCDEDNKRSQITLKGHAEKITCLTSIADSKLEKDFILTGSADKNCILWSYDDALKRWKNQFELKGHLAAISAVAGIAVSNDGNRDKNELLLYLASSDSANTIKIWECGIDTIACLQTISIHPHHSTALAFSFLPNTSIPVLFSGGSDLKITLYSKQGEMFEKQTSLSGHTDWIRAIKIATFTDTHNDEKDYGFQHGDLMIASASQDKYIRIWKVSSTGESNMQGSISDFDSQMLDAMKTLEGTQLSTKAHVFQVGSLKYSAMLDAILLGHDDWVLSVNWQPSLIKTVIDANGTKKLHQPMRLVSSSADKSILIWSPDEHSESWISKHRVGEVGGSTLGFYGAVFSSDGNLLLSNGYNGAIHIWKNENDTWKPQVGVSGHSQSVQAISWDPTGTFLLSTSSDQTSRIYAPWKSNNSTWHEISRSQIHGYNLQCCTFINKYMYVSGADEKVLRIFEAPRNFVKSLQAISGSEETQEEIDARPIGANLPALGLSNKAVFEGEESQVNHDGRLSAYTAGALASSLVAVQTQPPFEEHLLQNTLWPEKEKLYGHGYEIVSVGASPDGTMVASACRATKPEHASVRLWSTSKWSMLCDPLVFHTLSVTCISFSKSNKYVLTAGRDRSWALFDISGVQESKESGNQGWILKQSAPKAHSRIIWGSCFTGDDRAFATASRDKTIKLWGLNSNHSYELVETIRLNESVTAIDILPFQINECYLLAAGLDDGVILIYYFHLSSNNVVEIKRQIQVSGESSHSKTVKSLKWRPSEIGALQLASCSEDHSVRLFSVM